MSLKFPTKFPTLAGQALRLREMGEVDMPAWFARLSDPESSHLSGDPIPDSIDVCFEWLAGIREMYQSKESIRWVIEPTSVGESVGSIGVFDIDSDRQYGEMGTVIHRDYWNQGLVTQAGRLVLDYAFGELGLKKIAADCLVENAASRRVLEKLGFTLERVIPDYRTTDGACLEGLLYVVDCS